MYLEMDDSQQPGSLNIISVQNQLAVTHLGLVNPNTDKLYSAKDKHSRMESLPHHACLLHSEMKTQQPLHVATPVRQSLALTKVASTSVYLKLDSSQPTGSFKIRGIGHLCKTVSNPPCSGMVGLVCAGGL